jgi:hypothetical protein
MGGRPGTQAIGFQLGKARQVSDQWSKYRLVMVVFDFDRSVKATAVPRMLEAKIRQDRQEADRHANALHH